MQKETLRTLLDKYHHHQLSEAEWQELNEWYHRLHFGEQDFNAWIAEAGSEAKLADQLYSNFEQMIAGRQSKGKSRLIYRLAAAAAILLTMGAGIYYFYLPQKKPGTPDTRISSTQEPKILPGSDKAVLILGNGKQIILSEANTGKLAEQGQTAIRKTADGEITYHAPIKEGSQELIINTIATPRGGKYSLILADGTKVWLNSASSLKFPASFNGDRREVQLSGEGYFEVAHDVAKPFIVLSVGQSIEVVGTHFNVNAYADEPQIQTTLLEGSVKVISHDQVKTLKPGQQSRLTTGGEQIDIHEVNTEDVVAWINGYFLFQNENIQSVMRKISRWYDVEVEFAKGQQFSEQYGGSITRYSDVSKVLRMLEITGQVKFRIEGRRIIVSGK